VRQIPVVRWISVKYVTGSVLDVVGSSLSSLDATEVPHDIFFLRPYAFSPKGAVGITNHAGVGNISCEMPS